MILIQAAIVVNIYVCKTPKASYSQGSYITGAATTNSEERELGQPYGVT